MIDLLNYLNFTYKHNLEENLVMAQTQNCCSARLTGNGCKATVLAIVNIIVARIKGVIIIGKLNSGNDKVILLVRSVGAENDSMDTVVTICGSSHLREPLSRQ